MYRRPLTPLRLWAWAERTERIEKRQLVSRPAAADLIGGRVQIMFDAAPSLLQHVRSGKLRVLAAASQERNRLVPEAPTFAELDKLNGALGKALASPEIVERLNAQGAEPMPGTPEAFASFMRAEMAKWAPVVKQAGIKAE